jgi:hypothetical protein
MSAAGRSKNASQSSRTVAVRRLSLHRSATFQRQYDFSSTPWARLIVCTRKVPEAEQEWPPRAIGRSPVGMKGVTCFRKGARGASFSPLTERKGAQQPPSGGCCSRDHFLADIWLLRYHAFSVASFDTWCFFKIPNFSENSQCLATL